MILVDTSLLVRMARQNNPDHTKAVGAVSRLMAASERLVIAARNLYEFWVVATRPLERNGLAMEPKEAAGLIERFSRDFAVLPERDEVLGRWRQVVLDYAVRGKGGHDTRLVAVMAVHGVEGILTFNVGDFKRYGVRVLDPAGV